MKNLKTLLTAFLFYSALGFAVDVEAFKCSIEFAAAPYMTTHEFSLGKTEMMVTPVEVAAAPIRLLVGTAITDRPLGGTVRGGRFLLSHFGNQQPEVELSIPGYDGGATSASVLVVSNDGRYAAVSGGSIFGGPAYFFDLQSTQYEPFASRMETRNHYRTYRDLYWAQIHRGLAGDPHARFMLEQLGGMGQLFDAIQGIHREYGELPPPAVEQVDAMIKQIVEGMLGRPGADLGGGYVSKDEDEPIPTCSLDFSPNGTQYLADCADNLAIRDIVTGELDTRIYLTQSNGFSPLPIGGHSRFTNGGKHVVSYHRGYQEEALLALWDAEKGFACDQIEVDIAYDMYVPIDRAFARSPDARFFVLSGKSKAGFTTQVWTTNPNEWTHELLMVREFLSSSKEEGTEPPVAFSASGTYAVGLSDGSVELYGADRNRLSKKFENGHARRVSAVALSTDGKLLVSLSANESTLVLWSTTGEFEPIRLKGDANTQYFRFVKFLQDDDSQVLVESINGSRKELYLVDLFRMRAALRDRTRSGQ
ncbi:MAG: WD40 repeat domain-containing protein, partial [Bdellovibrionales bacterium]|nr:WD40 repeat domain-containing protein [Bdellovibrionales bacterium]